MPVEAQNPREIMRQFFDLVYGKPGLWQWYFIGGRKVYQRVIMAEFEKEHQRREGDKILREALNGK